MTASAPEALPCRPSNFSAAVATLLGLCDSTNEKVSGHIGFRNLTAPTWNIRMRATDWRVDDGDTLFVLLEVEGTDTSPPAARALFTPMATDERRAYGPPKVQQFQEALPAIQAGEHPLMRWVTALIDALPTRELENSLTFTRSTVREEIEIGCKTVVVRIVRTETEWELHLNKRIGTPLAEVVRAPFRCNERSVIYTLLMDAWVHGLRTRPLLAYLQ